MITRWWTASPPTAEVRQAVARTEALPGVVRVAVMPDVHLAGSFCVGVSVATRRWLYPKAIGNDVGCGVAAVRLGHSAHVEVDHRRARALLAAWSTLVPVLARPKAQLAPWPEDLDPDGPTAIARAVRTDGRRQLGTIGRGNHFLELQRDEEGFLWLTAHSGSRGLGGPLQAAWEGPVDGDSDAGQAYLRDLAWLAAWAEANRRTILSFAGFATERILGVAPDDSTLLSSDHNHVCAASIDGCACFIHRKGTVHAAPGHQAVIPGSMGTATVHIDGRSGPDALWSSSHGAGRALSRVAARQRFGRRELLRQLGDTVVDPAKLDLLRDEAPGAYKDLGAVMRAQRDLVRTRRRLRPVLTHKGA